jgi:hypothetical protein
MSGRNKVLFLIAILALVGLAFFARLGQAQKPTADRHAPLAPVQSGKLGNLVPIIGHAVGFAETKPLRDLVPEGSTVDFALAAEGKEINEQNAGDFGTPNPHGPAQKDGALQSSFPKGFTPNIPSPSLTFEGIPVQNSAPPDTTGAVGPNDYVQTVNSLVRVWDKNGVPRGPAFKLSSLFAALGGVVAAGDAGDQIVLYDRMANRWLISEFAFASQTSPPYHTAIAISKTGDPTGAYWVYDFVMPGSEFPDYPKFGAWSDAYYYSDRQFTNGGPYNGFGVLAFDRSKMLVGDPTATFIYFNAGPNLSQASSGMIPTDFNGLTPPPAGAPNVFAVFTDDAFTGDTADTVRLFNFHADFAPAGTPTFTERPESPLAMASFDTRNPSGRADIEEPAPAAAADYLDSIGDRLMLRLFYLNRGGTESLTTCFTVNSGVIPAPGILPTVAQYKAGQRYFILQKTSPANPYSIQDQGTYSPDASERWMGSTALDNAGNLAIGFSISSTSVFPSCNYAGRLLGDPPGLLSQGEATMFAGTGVQIGTSNRWGDYSNVSLDPADDATFWITNEYYATSPVAGFAWHTRVGKFQYAGTVAPPQGTLSGTITACDTGALLKDALVQVSGGPSTGFSSATKPDGTYSMNLSPGSYSVTISDPAHQCTAIGPFNVNITNGNTTTQNGCLSGTATFLYQSSLVSVSGGNGNGVIEPNECNNVNVTILNNGCFVGANVSAVLSSSTPGVTVTQPNSPYPNTNENASAVNAVPFLVSTDNTIVCGTTINFTLTVTFTGGTSTFSFSLPTCNLAPSVVSGALTASDLQQPVGRLGRNGVVSICGTAKACPGPLGAGPRLYDMYTFTNGPGPACVTIATTASCPSPANDIIPAAYLGSYDPTNFCTNYLGDPGGSPGAIGNSFSVNLAANATLVVVIQEANAGLAGCSGYTVTVSGLVGSGTGPGPCAPAPTVVSEKIHGGAGTFSIPMPLTGTSGVEDRTGNGGVAGTHTIRLSFTTDPTGATASVIAHSPGAGTGSVSGVSYSGNDMIVSLTGVSNAQVLTLSTSGGSVSPATVPIGFLAGDVNFNRAVNSTDILITKSRLGAVLDATNFRSDVNASGSISSTDVLLIKQFLATALP